MDYMLMSRKPFLFSITTDLCMYTLWFVLVNFHPTCSETANRNTCWEAWSTSLQSLWHSLIIQLCTEQMEIGCILANHICWIFKQRALFTLYVWMTVSSARAGMNKLPGSQKTELAECLQLEFFLTSISQSSIS